MFFARRGTGKSFLLSLVGAVVEVRRRIVLLGETMSSLTSLRTGAVAYESNEFPVCSA